MSLRWHSLPAGAVLAKTSASDGLPARMNRIEAEFWLRLKTGGEHVWIGYECLTLVLAADTRYTPDFVAVRIGGEIELYEVKGFMRDDARVKLRVAARAFPFAFFLAVKAKGGWTVERVSG